MFKFIKRLFTKKRVDMLSDPELRDFKHQLEKIQERLQQESKKPISKNLKRVYDSMYRQIASPLESLNDIKEVQDEEGNIKKFKEL